MIWILCTLNHVNITSESWQHLKYDCIGSTFEMKMSHPFSIPSSIEKKLNGELSFKIKFLPFKSKTMAILNKIKNLEIDFILNYVL